MDNQCSQDRAWGAAHRLRKTVSTELNRNREPGALHQARKIQSTLLLDVLLTPWRPHTSVLFLHHPSAEGETQLSRAVAKQKSTHKWNRPVRMSPDVYWYGGAAFWAEPQDPTIHSTRTSLLHIYQSLLTETIGAQHARPSTASARDNQLLQMTPVQT